MKRKLLILGIALMGVAAAVGFQPRTATAANCFCADPECCNICCQITPGKLICTLRACL